MLLSLTFSAIKFIFIGTLGKKGCDLFVDGKTFSPQNDRLHLFLCNYSFKTLLIIYMKKEQSTSVTVAHSNHFSYIASFSHHISILVCFILPHSVFSTVLLSTFLSVFATSRNAFWVLSLFCAVLFFFSHFIYCLSYTFAFLHSHPDAFQDL